MTVQRRMRVVTDSENGHLGEDSSKYTGLRVGFASDDMLHANQHFGSAKSLVIYEINPERAQLIEVAEFSYDNAENNEGKLGEKIEMLEGCIAVYSQAVGSSAAQKLLAAGIQPVKVHDDAKISTLIEYLQDEMLQGPSAWLAKAINRQKTSDLSRFSGMEVEGWDE